MTERFTLAYEKGNWWAVRDGDITLWKEEVIATLNEFDEITIQQEKNSKNKDKLIKQHNNKIKKLNKEKRFILHTIHNKLLKYKEEAQDTKYDNFNTPDYYHLRGKIEVLTNLEDILESYEVKL